MNLQNIYLLQVENHCYGYHEAAGRISLHQKERSQRTQYAVGEIYARYQQDITNVVYRCHDYSCRQINQGK